MKKIIFLQDEVWAKLILPPNYTSSKQYAVSNYGRIAAYVNDVESGNLLKTKASAKRQPRFSIRVENKNSNRTVSHEVATHFLPKQNETFTRIIHLDNNLENNHVNNLKWVSEGEYRKYMLKRTFIVSSKNSTFKRGDQRVKIFPTEQIKELEIPELSRKYVITSLGRFISYFDDIEKDGILMNLSLHEEGYKIWRYKCNKKSCHMLLHRLVATHFVNKPSDLHEFVIHKDHNKLNNAANNLQWATVQEKTEHSKLSEATIKNNIRNATAEQMAKRGYKLTESKVRIIKKILFDRKRTTRLKMIAKQFGISPMQLRRIQTGENWGWVEA